MPRPIVVDEIPINIVELKDELNKIKKRDEELNFRASKCDEFLNEFVLLSAKESEELKKKIEDLKVTRLKPEHIAKIIEILPTTVNDLKVVLQGFIVSVSNDNMKKIVDVVKGYASPGRFT